MSYLSYTLGVLVIIVGVAISIALHEVGHLLPAKAFGVKCTQFMVGFGRTVWSRRRGETEYGMKAIPMGGYVRMIGMFPPKAGRPARSGRPGRWGMLADQARADAHREVGLEDADRLFYQRSVPKRIVIMLGGPTMNLVLAVLFTTIVLSGFGLPQDIPVVSAVSACVLPADAPIDRQCTPADPVAPAAQAGLRPGDRIVAFAGTPVATWDEVRALIRRSAAKPVALTVERDGTTLELTATPILSQRTKVDAQGQPVLGAGGKQVLEPVGFLGVSPTLARVRQPVSSVPGVMGDQLSRLAGVMVQIPQRMYGVAQSIAGVKPRDPNGPVSVVGIVRFGGEVASAQGTSAAPFSLADKIATWFGLLAGLNLALFAFNLIPLLPLDGGHVAGALWEAVKRGYARARHLPDPGPVDVAKALPLAYGVATLLIGMSALLIVADLVRPIRLTG